MPSKSKNLIGQASIIDDVIHTIRGQKVILEDKLPERRV